GWGGGGPAEGSRSGRRAGEVGAAAAAPANAPSRGMRRRSAAAGDDARLPQGCERTPVAGDVELVSRRASEGTLPVGPDLRLHSQLAQQAECASGNSRGDEVEVERDLAVAQQVHASGGVEERGQLGEAIASTGGSDLSELVPDVLREHARARAAVA